MALCLVALGAKTVGIVARKDAGIKDLKDLKGKKIAIQAGTSTGNIATNIILPEAGLKKGDYEVANISVTDMMAALGQGSVQAMQNVEPYNSIAVAKGIGVRLVDYQKYDPTPIFVAIRGEFLEKNRDTVVEFLKGLEATSRLFEKQPDQAYEIVFQFYKKAGLDVDQVVIKESVSRLQVQTAFPTDIKKYMQQTAEWQKGQGQIKEIPDWDKALRGDVLEQAKKELGA